MKKIVLAAVGAVIMLVGVAGLVLPFLPGWALIFVGLSLIAPKLAERLKRRVLRKFAKHEIVYLEKWQKTGTHAGFTTRHFPLFLSKTDDLLDTSHQQKFQKSLSESKIALAHGIPGAVSFAFLNQVHGNNVAVLDDTDKIGADAFYRVKETDGAITNIKGRMLLVMTADCLPIFYRAPGWAGLVHAGWRGTKGEIAKNAYELIKKKAGCADADIHIIFGPCICESSYEVGPEFRSVFPKKSLRERKGKTYFDLPGENKRQLFEAGALSRNLTDYDLCTVEENEDFYSFRKEGAAAGRMVSFIVLGK